VRRNSRNPEALFRHASGQMHRLIKIAQRIGARNSEGWFLSHAVQFCLMTCFAVLALAVGSEMLRSHAQSPQGTAAAASEKTSSTAIPAPAQQDKQQTGSAPADQHSEGGKQKIASECANLLKMATDLKAEVDKTTKDTLSVTVVRKAGEIQRLAHKVRTRAGKS
jgi:hypothetical protein